MYEGKAAIHMAVVESYLPIVRLLIEYHADLDIKVCRQCSVGATPISIYNVHVLYL